MSQEADYYYAIVHPDALHKFMCISRKWDWKLSYRAWRKSGKPEVNIRELIDKFPPAMV